MGRGRRRWSAAAGLLVALAGVGPARADPILRPPALGRGLLLGPSPGGATVAILAELQAVGVLGAGELGELPDYGALDGDPVELGLARVGILARPAGSDLTLVLRLDAGEPLRIDSEQFDAEPVAAVDAVIDDAAVWWTPSPLASVVVGRGKVPFSRYRQLERALLATGTVPFGVDRVAPDRRWGVTALGDLGAIAYAGGIYADADQLELVRAAGDPSARGRVAMAMHLEWTPIAPIGADHLATPSDDPWYGELRMSAGLGALYRLRAEGGRRLDLSLSGQLKLQRLAALAELLVSSDEDGLALGAAGETGVIFADRCLVLARGEYDGEVELYSAGAGLGYFVARDRRSRLAAFAFVRRPVGGGASRDGALVVLHLAL